MSTETRTSRARTLLRPTPQARPTVWAASLGADLSSLSDGANREEASSEAVAELVAVPVAAPVAEVETASEPSVAAVDDRQPLQSVLEELLVFDGSIGVALVDGQSGMVLGEAGSAGNLGLSAAGASVILRARLETNKALGLGEEVDDVLITLSSQIQIIHPLAKNPKLFLYMIGDKTKSSLAMARYKASEADVSIRL